MNKKYCSIRTNEQKRKEMEKKQSEEIFWQEYCIKTEN